MNSLRSRLAGLDGEMDARQGPGRLVLIRCGPRPIAEPIPNGLLLRAPTPVGDDPRECLTPEQRALINPRDRLIVVRYADRPLGDVPGESGES